MHTYNRQTLTILVVILAFVLNACSSQEDTQAAKQPPTPSPMTASEETSQATDLETKEKVAQQASEPAPQETTTPAAETTPTTTPTPTTEKPDIDQANLALARKSGCLSCHAVDKKVVGPAWRDVAKRYKDDPNAKSKLINKVSKGGRGNWTDVVGPAAMPPYSPRVTDENIAQLVEFVLSLKQQ